jgi:predicted DNA-binding transcriptional regulator YafY
MVSPSNQMRTFVMTRISSIKEATKPQLRRRRETEFLARERVLYIVWSMFFGL